MNPITNHSIRMKSKSGATLYVPSHKKNNKSKIRLVKSFQKRIDNHVSQRHSELILNKKTYNCITSCDVINVIAIDCNKGLFAALCIKCALCIKDIQMRMIESKRSPMDIKTDVENVYVKSKIVGNTLQLSNQKYRFVYVFINNVKMWEDVIKILQISWISEIYKSRSFSDGFWYRMAQPILSNKKDYNAKQNLAQGNHIIHKKIFNLTNVKDGNYKSQWELPVSRIYKCLLQIKKGYEICNPTDVELKNVKKIVDSILKNKLNQIEWSKLASTFMGGLLEFDDNKTNIQSEVKLLENLHYLKKYEHVKNALKEYGETI